MKKTSEKRLLTSSYQVDGGPLSINKIKGGKEKGYSLIELLAVIVILGIIMLIVIPLILNVINDAKKGAFRNSVYGIIKTTELEQARLTLEKPNIEELIFSYTDGIETSNIVGINLKYRGTPPENGRIVLRKNGDISVSFHNGKWCAEKGYNESKVIVTDKSIEDCITPLPVPTIELIGDSPQYVEINTSYIDLGVIARLINGDITIDVVTTIKKGNQVVNDIDVTKLGKYEVIYSVTDENKVVELLREVIVRDTINPILIVPTSTTLKVEEVNSFDLLEGVSVSDNSLEELVINVSGNISRLPGTYTVTYSAEDSSGNEIIIVRTIIVVDNDAPIITILGDNPVTVIYGTTYSDQGATAVDDAEGDLTDKIVVTGFVNTTVLGKQQVIYTVKDSSGNESTAIREVFVIDNIAPIINFGTNGNSTYSKIRSTTVTVSDFQSGVDESSLRYLWSTSVDEPSEASINTTFTNGGSITSQSNLTGTYYLWILAKDNSGNATISKSNLFNLDNVKPVITLNGESLIVINIGTIYNELGATAVDNIDGDITNKITTSGIINTNNLGDQELTYKILDTAGNEATVTRTIKVVDNIKPIITFGTNGNSTYEKSRSTTVVVTDAHSGVNNSSLKYLWTTNAAEPNEASIVNNFNNNGTITTPNNLTGKYYLWVIAKDNSGNTTIARSNVFNLDNTPPVITLNGNSVINIERSSVYNEPGATATDADSGISGSVIITGAVNVNIAGSYTITYNVSDRAGNAASPLTRTVNVIVSDYTPPTVTFSPNGSSYTKSTTTRVSVSDSQSGVDNGSLRYQWTTSISTPSDGSFNTSFQNGVTISTPANATGTYYLWIFAKDNAGNKTTVRSNVFNLDNVNSTIIFGTNGNNAYAKSRSSSVQVSDSNSGVNASSLRYLWNTSTTTPSEGSFSTSFSNNSTVNSPAGLTGTYYLWVLAKDNAGNVLIERTNAFNLDNEAPTITFGTNGDSAYNKVASSIVRVNDNGSGVNTSSLRYLWNTSTTTPSEGSFSTSFSNNGTVSSPSNISGGYYLWILAKDSASNTTIARSNIFNIDNNPPTLTGVNLSISSLTETSINISMSGTPRDNESGLHLTPYIYQVSTNNSSWTTKCTSSSSSCNATSLSIGVNYYYRVCVRDKVLNETCSASQLGPILFYTKFINGRYILTGDTTNYVKIGSNVWRVMYRSGTNVRMTTLNPITNFNASFDPYSNSWTNSSLRRFTTDWCNSNYSSYASSCDAMTKAEVQCINTSSCSNLANGARLTGYLGTTFNYWTQTPDGSKNVWVVAGTVSGTTFESRMHAGVLPAAMRPVMNVKPTTRLLSGAGTSSNPYIISP